LLYVLSSQGKSVNLIYYFMLSVICRIG